MKQKIINLLNPRFAIQSIPDHSANHSPYNMSHMGNIVPNRNTIPDLLPYKQNRHQNERNRYFDTVNSFSQIRF